VNKAIVDIKGLPLLLLQDNHVSGKESNQKTISVNPHVIKKEIEDEIKTDKEEGKYRSKGYIKYPAYDFF